MSQQDQPPASREIRVAETSRDVIRGMQGHADAMFRAALAPFTACFLVKGGVALAGGQNPVLDLVAFAVTLVATTMFVVDVHRISLLGDTAARDLPRIAPTPRDWRYLGRFLIVSLMVALVLMLPVLILAPGLLAMPGGIYIASVAITLLALAGVLAVGHKLPATAVARDVSLGASWTASRRNLPALLGLVLVLVAPLHIVATALSALHVAASLGGMPVVPTLLASLAMQFVELALFATLLSVIYRRSQSVNLSA
jgi:hypothetical protein